MSLLLLLACSDFNLQSKDEPPTNQQPQDSAPVDSDPPVDTGDSDTTPGVTDTDTDPPDTMVATELVYAHTGATLYGFDPSTSTINRIGDFTDGGRALDAEMTDIAIDLNGYLYGVTWYDLYQIDPMTADCTWVQSLRDQGVGLTFVSDGRLVIAGEEVNFLDINTGALTPLLTNSQYTTSGDIVGLPDGFLYWTVSGWGGDDLVRVDPNTGDTELVGNTGAYSLYGVGYANGLLYAFSSTGQVVILDPATGTSGGRTDLGPSWYGATTNPVLW